MERLSLSILLALFVINNSFCFSQRTNTDTARVKPTQYRRGVELNNNYQSYEKKYAGKNLLEEKEKVFPLHYTGVKALNKLSKMTSITGTWTELNPKVPRVDYVGIDFVNKDTGWACGDLGAIIKTTDGGKSWNVIPTNTTKPILRVRSYNGKTVIASGYNGLILRSTDSGETFEQVETGVDSLFDLWGLDLVNDTLGWACGATALLKTTNDGRSWVRVNTAGYTGNLWWIDFLNENYGFIAADGNVLKTTDGGNNWEIIQAGDEKSLYCVDVIDSMHIAAAGYGGTNYSAKNIYSDDGGNTWTNGDTLTTEAVNCIKYINPDIGYLVMNNVDVRKTTNRGKEWTHMAGLSDSYELKLLNNKIGYSVGPGLKINKTENGYENWKRLIMNDNFSDVFFINDQKGFAISSYSYAPPFTKSYGLYETTDGGINWVKDSGAPNGVDLLFIDSLTGFIGSDKIYKTTDGGLNWYVPNGGESGAGKIFFINNKIGWAIHSNVIYKTTDIGEDWYELFTVPLSNNFSGIYFADSLNGWTSGARPYKTTDGGNNWTLQTNTDIWNSDDVYFTNKDTGWIAKYSSISNSLFKTIDGGVNWIHVPEVIGARKFYHFPDSVHWLILGFSRYYVTNDYGKNWLEITEDVPGGLVSFSAQTDNLGYFVGNLGLVLRYEDTSYVSLPVLNISDTTINFGTVKIGTTEEDSILISNTGSSTLQISEIISFNQHFAFYPSKLTLTKSEQAYLKVLFTPTDTSFQSGLIVMTNNALSSPDTTFVQGKGSSIDAVENNKKIPANFKLNQNYPNPFNPITNITFEIPKRADVKIILYDITGREISVLLNKNFEAGYYSIPFNSGNLTSGVYFYRMTTNEYYTAVKKLIIIK